MGHAVGSKQTPKPQLLAAQGVSKSCQQKQREVSITDSHYGMVLLLLDIPVRARGTHLAAGMGVFSPPKGVKTVFLVLTTLSDAGPSSQPILMGQGYFYLASALFHQLIELVDFGTGT